MTKSDYDPPRLFRNPHIQTIYPAVFRRVSLITDLRERIPTPDGDFLDLDWKIQKRTQSRTIVVITHGLEGNSRGPYAQGMAQALSSQGNDLLAWNFRGCSGEPNTLLKSYHSGATEELRCVLDHALATGRYDSIIVIGFSLGGNLTLKFLGEEGQSSNYPLLAGVGISVPCDLRGSAKKLETAGNWIYMKRFMKSLTRKLKQKAILFPDEVDITGINSIRTFSEFDDRYTAPIHGFASAEDYWRESSCKNYLGSIATPTLIINAADDPFLTKACYPTVEAQRNTRLHLLMPNYGGHLGFYQRDVKQCYWHEEQTRSFLGELKKSGHKSEAALI